MSDFEDFQFLMNRFASTCKFDMLPNFAVITFWENYVYFVTTLDVTASLKGYLCFPFRMFQKHSLMIGTCVSI